MQETRIRSLGWEDPLEKGIAIHSSILAWRIPWTEKSGGAQFMGLQRVRYDSHTHTHTFYSCAVYLPCSVTHSYDFKWHIYIQT